MPRRARRYLIELVVVALGVMMGLAASEAVRAMNDAREVRAIREALDEELANGYFAVEMRQEAAPCVESRIRKLTAWLDQPASQRRPLPDHIGGLGGLVAYTTVWDVAKGNGAAAKMPVADLLRYAEAYGAIDNFNWMRESEQDHWALLADLGGMRELEAREAILMRVRLDRSLRYQAVFEGNRGMMAELFADMGIQPMLADEEAVRDFKPSICSPLFEG